MPSLFHLLLSPTSYVRSNWTRSRGTTRLLPIPAAFPWRRFVPAPDFSNFMHELRKPQFREIMGSKLGINLETRPVTITVRGQARRTDGRIHLDSNSKLVTVLVYMNGEWEADGGRLRLLHSPNSLDDVVMEVPPARGTLLAFLNVPECVARSQTVPGRAARGSAQLGPQQLGGLARKDAAQLVGDCQKTLSDRESPRIFRKRHKHHRTGSIDRFPHDLSSPPANRSRIGPQDPGRPLLTGRRRLPRRSGSRHRRQRRSFCQP